MPTAEPAMSSTTPDVSGREREAQLRVEVVRRQDLPHVPRWGHAFANERKDRRYYELIEDTLHPEFDYRYFVIKDEAGEAHAVQPFVLLDQDLAAGTGPRLRALIAGIRRVWPRFMLARTLMVGCVAGEGHLDGDQARHAAHASVLASSITHHARTFGAQLIALKEFPAQYRAALDCFLRMGFTRIPSMPMTRLRLDYASFDDYMQRALNSATRTKLRRKFRAAGRSLPIQMSIVDDVTPLIDQIYPLYLQVYRRSSLHFERLTARYFCELGNRVRNKARFFLWRQDERIVAFAACMTQGDSFYAEYIGLDYEVALDLHLYHYAYRDMVSWAITNGYAWFRSSGLNYDPKLHLRHQLDPLDLYVRHTSPSLNVLMRQILPLIEPTRYDATLPKFSNFDELRPGRTKI